MMTETDINRAINSITVFLVNTIMEQKKCTQEEAVELLMKTVVYEALMDKETMLYCESKEAVADRLLKEIQDNMPDLLAI